MSRAAQAVGLKIKLGAEPMSPGELGNHFIFITGDAVTVQVTKEM